ncbi:fumarylacetoacetate hydrolase family protein [Hugenholtzia roseola]|uniref:fumarylacetoacetate hydrolase family protein n=1 Tax=Hugenholtzia roseola TaxID=1002 RepID=UPI0004045273|nr:fumarylacetoacetate hydrolase family protein [Hugenholtzia roseola]
MKIIAIGRNYADHIAELANERPAAPVVFLKPDTAVLKNNAPFYHPDFSNDIHHELEIILRISREGKYIDKKFAPNYYDKIGLGIDFTARDLQNQLKAKGLPWEIAKGFNGSAPISDFVPKEHFANLKDLNFSLSVNGQIRQQGNSKLMIWDFDEIIAYVSQFFTLKVGDIIFTGTPAGVAAVKIGDRLEAFLETEKILDFEVK